MTKSDSLFMSIIGASVFRAWRGYQSVFFLECGSEVSPGKGEYTIGFDYCPWRLLRDDVEIASGNAPLSVIDLSIQKLVGSTITDVDIRSKEHKTSLYFGNAFVIETLHQRPGQQWYLIGSGQEAVVGYDCQITALPNA